MISPQVALNQVSLSVSLFIWSMVMAHYIEQKILNFLSFHTELLRFHKLFKFRVIQTNTELMHLYTI
jgi:hypothetical protein